MTQVMHGIYKDGQNLVVLSSLLLSGSSSANTCSNRTTNWFSTHSCQQIVLTYLCLRMAEKLTKATFMQRWEVYGVTGGQDMLSCRDACSLAACFPHGTQTSAILAGPAVLHSWFLLNAAKLAVSHMAVEQTVQQISNAVQEFEGILQHFKLRDSLEDFVNRLFHCRMWHPLFVWLTWALT